MREGPGFQHLALQPMGRHHLLAQPACLLPEQKSPTITQPGLPAVSAGVFYCLLCSRVIKRRQKKERKEMQPMQLTS